MSVFYNVASYILVMCLNTVGKKGVSPLVPQISPISQNRLCLFFSFVVRASREAKFEGSPEIVQIQILLLPTTTKQSKLLLLFLFTFLLLFLIRMRKEGQEDVLVLSSFVLLYTLLVFLPSCSQSSLDLRKRRQKGQSNSLIKSCGINLSCLKY